MHNPDEIHEGQICQAFEKFYNQEQLQQWVSNVMQ